MRESDSDDRLALSAAATRAIAAAIDGAGGPAAFGQVHDVDVRTVERMDAGRRDVPPGLAREVAASLDHVTSRRAAEHAAALRAWADACGVRMGER